MYGGPSSKRYNPRELRRRVVMSARLRHESRWSDASILNISSRGLLIHTSRPLDQGSAVQVCRGDHVINARVVWRQGAKAGLHAEERLPVEAIASSAIGSDLRPQRGERRRRPRLGDEGRHTGKWFQFAGLVGISGLFAAGLLAMMSQALARSLALVTVVLR